MDSDEGGDGDGGWWIPTFSLTQMYLSDSMVRELNPILAALIPTLVSCKDNSEPATRFKSVSSWFSAVVKNFYILLCCYQTTHKQQFTPIPGIKLSQF